jgi:hypothetical protein
MKVMSSEFDKWFCKQREKLEVNEYATLTDADEFCMKQGWDARQEEITTLKAARLSCAKELAEKDQRIKELEEALTYVLSNSYDIYWPEIPHYKLIEELASKKEG